MSPELEDILSNFIDSDGKCKICGQDHRFTPNFEDVKTSIDIIPELFNDYSKPKIVKEVVKTNA